MNGKKKKKKMSTMRRELATLSLKTDYVIDSSFKSLHHNQFINEVNMIKDKKKDIHRTFHANPLE